MAPADPQVRAEIEKLAALLSAEPARLAALEALDETVVRALREAATDRLFDADRAIFDRLAAAARLVPDGLAAGLSQRAFGPLLTARLSSAVDPPKAISVAAKLPLEFLADVATRLDPRRASQVLAGLPPRRVAEISRLLAERGEWVAMARFVGHLGSDALRLVVDDLDEDGLRRILFLLGPEDLVALRGVAAESGMTGRLEAMLPIEP